MIVENSMENILFDKAISKVQLYLRTVGLQIDQRDRNKKFLEKFRYSYKWWLLFNILWLSTDIVAEFAWLIEGVKTGKSFTELTKLAPCAALCLLTIVQAYYFTKHSEEIFQLIDTIRKLQSLPKPRLDNEDEKFLTSSVKFFNIAINGLTVGKVTILIAFGVSPFIILANTYHKTGEIELIEPFSVSYPFDKSNPKLWPIVYFHEMWSAVVAVWLYLAPYYLCYACSTFVIFQFHLLKNDLERFIPPNDSLRTYLKSEDTKEKLVGIIERHRDIIQCVNLMEIIYSETTLCNFVLGSFLICLTGFNVVAINEIVVVVPFLEFMVMGLLQVYLICHYGDMIMNYSMDVGVAVYSCQWYRAELSIVKDLMIISARARIPCKMTALRFSDVNFKTFARILSTSWSYFALLTSVYKN